MALFDSILDTIGNTPIIRLPRIAPVLAAQSRHSLLSNRPRDHPGGRGKIRERPMFALLAYTVTTLFVGISVFGHVLLLRDIFSAGPSDPPTRLPAPPEQEPQDWRKAA